MISGSLKARLGYMCPVDGLRQPRPRAGEIARVGGHRRQPVLNINQKSHCILIQHIIRCNLKIKAKLYYIRIIHTLTLKVQEVVQSTWSCKNLRWTFQPCDCSDYLRFNFFPVALRVNDLRNMPSWSAPKWNTKSCLIQRSYCLSFEEIFTFALSHIGKWHKKPSPRYTDPLLERSSTIQGSCTMELVEPHQNHTTSLYFSIC